MRFAGIFIVFFVTGLFTAQCLCNYLNVFSRKTLAELLCGRFFCLQNNITTFFYFLCNYFIFLHLQRFFVFIFIK
jgi:hypothetical protein